MQLRKNIPNAITCGNLLCGCYAIVKAFDGDLTTTAYLVGLAAVLDFFDGFVARILGVSSPIGKDLDSLADMVTFGAVPGIVMFKLITNSINLYAENHSGDFSVMRNYLPFAGFLIILLSAIRLAKFNNDPRQSDSFIGLPTPANAIFLTSFAFVLSNNGPETSDLLSKGFWWLYQQPWLMCLLAVIMGFLLVSEIPLFALKFKHFKWKGNEIRFIFLALSLFLLIALKVSGIPLIIILYLLMSVLNNTFVKEQKLS